MESLAQLYGKVTKEELYDCDVAKFDPTRSPFLFVKLQNDDICKKIAKRAVMINRFTEVISRGETLEQLLENVEKPILDPILARKERFRFKVEAMNRKLSMKEAREIIEKYAIFDF